MGWFDGFSGEKKKKESYILSLWDYFDGVIEKRAAGWLTGRRTREEERGSLSLALYYLPFLNKAAGLFHGWERKRKRGKEKGIT